MKKISHLTLLVFFILSACTLLPRPTQKSNPSTPIPTTATSENVISCAPENWVIAITSVEQTDLGDGTKLVFAKIGIENNDSLWGKVTGPNVSDEAATQKPVLLTTKDGSNYENLDSLHSIPLENPNNRAQSPYKITRQIETPLLPPLFVALGITIDGHPSYYNFAFQIPNSQIPTSITIGGMLVECILPYRIGENGKPTFRGKSVPLPIKTYDLNTDVVDIRNEPSARRYPNLVGAELISPDWKETIFITDVTRDGNEITVVFDFINFSSHEVSPSFNGYIMGSNRLFICQNDCEQRPPHEPVKPGQTAQELTWTFIVPENETNLTFVYVYGRNVDLNEVYRINLE